MNTPKITILVLALLIIGACKPSKKTSATKPVDTKPLVLNDVLARLANNEIKADWLSGDVGVDYSGKPMNVSGSLDVRFRRDSVIWVNIKKLGFSLARARVTRDSIHLINYLQSSYAAKDFKYIEERFGIPADFKILQSILLGNPIFLTDRNKLKIERDAATGDVILRGSNEQWTNTYKLDPATFLLKEMILEQPITARSLKMICEDYRPLRGLDEADTRFSYIRTIQIESPQTGKAEVFLETDANDLEVNKPKTIRFEIPAHYARMD